MSVRIITDSPSDITREEAKELNINIVPLKINVDGASYREGIDITTDEFYERLEASEELPTTSTPSPEDFLEYYKVAKEAEDDVIVITLASSLSGTYQCANLAKDMSEYSNIHVIDSEQAALGEMVLVRYAIQLRDEGKSAVEIVEIIEKAKKKTVLLAVLDTLDYLHKGGRLPKGVAVASGLLKIKPIIKVEAGSLKLTGTARGYNGGMKNLLKLIDDYDEFNPDTPVLFGYTGKSADQVKIFKEKADEKYNLENTNIYQLGSVIGTHAGPGAFAIGFIQK